MINYWFEIFTVKQPCSLESFKHLGGTASIDIFKISENRLFDITELIIEDAHESVNE